MQLKHERKEKLGEDTNAFERGMKKGIAQLQQLKHELNIHKYNSQILSEKLGASVAKNEAYEGTVSVVCLCGLYCYFFVCFGKHSI